MAAAASADCAAGLVRRLTGNDSGLLVRGCRDLEDVNMLWLGRAASAGTTGPQHSDCLPADHTVRIVSHVQLARIARSASSSSLWSSSASPGIFTISKVKK
jgi:hypothetical protein